MQHEKRHAAVTRRAQRLAVERARRYLRWATGNQAGVTSTIDGRAASQREALERVDAALSRALDEAIAYGEKENDKLDQPERYLAESNRQPVSTASEVHTTSPASAMPGRHAVGATPRRSLASTQALWSRTTRLTIQPPAWSVTT